MAKELATLCLIFTTFTGMAQADTKSRNYQVGEFNKITIHGGGNLQIHPAGKHALEVKSGNTCDDIDVLVTSKTLYIKINDSQTNTCDITILVGVPSLIELVQIGGGNVVLSEGFSPQDSFICEVNGGGNINISELSVNSFYASIKNGGVILLHAENELEANISGGGLIKYAGDPEVRSNVSGGGSINKKIASE